jgi:hypothetical protein
MRKRRVHKKIFTQPTAFTTSVTTDAIHQELTDGFCFQVNFTGTNITEINFKVQTSVDYNIVAEGSENWIDILSTTCAVDSGSTLLNIVNIFTPYFRIVAEVVDGDSCDTLEIFKYSHEEV